MDKIKDKIVNFLKMRERTLSFFGQNQYSDWKVLLIFLSVCMLFVVFFGGYYYINIGDDVDLFASNSSASNNKKINKEALAKMIGQMEERQKKFEDLKINKPVVMDPSL